MLPREVLVDQTGLSNCSEFSRVVIEKEFCGQSKICGIGVTEDTRLVPHKVKGEVVLVWFVRDDWVGW